jgi:hypothetical protein
MKEWPMCENCNSYKNQKKGNVHTYVLGAKTEYMYTVWCSARGDSREPNEIHIWLKWGEITYKWHYSYIAVYCTWQTLVWQEDNKCTNKGMIDLDKGTRHVKNGGINY